MSVAVTSVEVRGLSSADLLRAWELGADRGAVDRALLLLSLGVPGLEWAELLSLPLGRRDALLLRVRACSFGRALGLRAHCPACEEGVEFTATVDELLTGAVDAAPETGRVEAEGLELELGAPNSRDLGALDLRGDPRAVRRALGLRCVRVARRDGAVVDPETLGEDETLGDEWIDAISRELERLDPGGHLEFRLACPACSAEWTAPLDVVAHMWSEVEQAARSVLNDVHDLARAYGWRERDILAMTPARRAFYLERVLS